MKRPNDIVQVLFGSEAKYSRCPAYCIYHHKYLTEKQIKYKNCLGKQCKCLKKIEEHRFWKEREKKKEMKKRRSL